MRERIGAEKRAAARVKVSCALLSSLAILLSTASAVPANGQEDPAPRAATAPSNADANNPRAEYQAFDVHNC